MKNALGVFSLVALMGFAVSASAMTEKQASKQIAEAVAGIKPMAGSGIETIKVEAGLSVKETLLAVAIKKGYSSDENDFSWVGKASSAWDAESTNFGETNMKEAYSYIMKIDNTDSSQTKGYKHLEDAKEAFKLFLGTGVKFGVAPMGAVQCGATFAALAIIDPNTGKVYLFSKEGSGC